MITNAVFYTNGWRPPRGPMPSMVVTPQGGAIFEYQSNSLITNVIFAENAARFDGGAVYSRPRLPNPMTWTTITHCLFYSNTPNDIDKNRRVTESHNLWGENPYFVNLQLPRLLRPATRVATRDASGPASGRTGRAQHRLLPD